MEVSSKIAGARALRAGCLNFTELSAIAVANIAPTLTAVLIMSLMYGAAGNGSWLAYLFGAVMLVRSSESESVRPTLGGDRFDARVHGDGAR
jgi:hypothetical protein